MNMNTIDCQLLMNDNSNFENMNILSKIAKRHFEFHFEMKFHC